MNARYLNLIVVISFLLLLPYITWAQRPDSTTTATITLVGDIMSHSSQIRNAMLPDSSYDYRTSFAEVKPYLSSADITIGNLETTFAGPDKPYTGYPGFNTPDALAVALKDAGFDLLVTANNHSTDNGDQGLLRTIDVLQAQKLSYTGTFKDSTDRDSIRIMDVKGIKLAVLNYTYGVNGSLPSKSYMLNVIDSALIHTDVKAARKTGADLVLVYFHYGLENKVEPTDLQKRQVQFAISAGADIVIGAHSHVLSPMEMFKADTSAKVDTGFIAWGLGNFISNQYWRYTDAGVIVDIEIEKDNADGSVRIAGVQYLPTWVYRGRSAKMKQHIVLPDHFGEMDSLPNYLSNDQIELMRQAFDDTRKVMSTTDTRIQTK